MPLIRFLTVLAILCIFYNVTAYTQIDVKSALVKRTGSVGFITPDTVCVTQPVNITNTSTGTSSYYWNFCVADLLNTPPTGTNLGNPGNTLNGPVFSDFVESNGNYYVFVVNHYDPTGIVRMDFGNSLLNTPTATNLGNFGNTLRRRPEGIQVVYDNGKWYAFVVGGDPTMNPPDIPQLVRIDFGANIENPNPVATDLGNIGNMVQPLDLYMFKENNIWHAFTVNKDGSMSRFSFNNGLDNPPAVQNYPLGLNYPTGVNVVNENGKFYVFVTVALSNSIARLDFGNSLLNNPVVVDLGDPGNTQTRARDIYIMRFCNSIVGFVVNGPNDGPNPNQLVRLDFNNNIESVPSGVLLGNIGNLSFPHSLSKLFRVKDKVYSFITNVSNNTITRLEFPSCNNSDRASSTLKDPPSIKYNTPGVYNINLTVDDGLPTQSSFCRQVVVVPEPVHTPTKTIVIKQGETVKIGTGNASGTFKWNTVSDNKDSISVQNEGLYYVETDGYGCHNIDSFIVVFKEEGADFSYQQDACDPLKLTFKNETPDVTVVDWDFGNGLNAPGNPNPTTSYDNFGNYNVTLTVKNTSGTTLQVTKQIPVNIQTDSLIITRDTTICAGASIQLNAIPALNYCWSPTETLNNSSIANPVATPIISTTYFLNTLITGTNVIINGDFSGGNTGFASEYKYVKDNTTEGEYFVGNSSLAWNPHLIYNCADHSGTGNMLLVNGSPEDNKIVWTETVNVLPNTNYAFSTWIESHFQDNPAQLAFFINGIAIGTPINASLPICNWTQFYTTWNSGNNASAIISIVNKNTISWGNDFALDDISFAPVFIKRDSVRISVEKPIITASNDTTICTGTTAQLSASQGFSSYSWTQAASLSNGNIYNPVAKPAQTTQYIVSGTSVNGCNAKDTVTIAVNALPMVKTNNDTLVCGTNTVQLNTTGNAVEYVWTPETGLSDPFIKNPVANPLISTQYTVTGKSTDGCIASDTVNIKVGTVLSIKTNNDTLICESNNVQLHTSGNVANYVWTPASGLSNSAISNPIATPLVTTQYIVTATSIDGCSGKDTVTINVNARPVISINNDTLVCNRASIQLKASASGVVSYSWTPAATLNNAAISNPVAQPGKNTMYTVVVTDVTTGCFNSNSVQVSVRPYPTFSAMSDIDICKGTNVQLHASGGDDYEWNPPGTLDDAQSPDPVANPASTTQYSVHITDLICNYDTSINVNVGVNPSPLVTAQKSNDINCEQPTSQLTARGADSYVWTPANHLDNATKYNPVASIDTTTMFIVKGTGANGCYSFDSVTVKVSKEGNPLYLVPNAFTPNNDGINDCLSLKKWGNVQLQEFSIYNRWGERVFTTTNPMACWDGTFKGQPQNTGTFVYVVRAKTFCGTVTRKGLVTLLR